MKKLFFYILLLSITNAYAINNVRYIDAPSGLRMRENPDLDSKKILVIPYNQKVDIVEEEKKAVTIDGVTGKWTKIKYQDQTGWVFGGFLTDIDINEYQNIIDSKKITASEKTNKLNTLYEKNKDKIAAAKILFEIGNIAKEMKVTIDEFKKNSNYKTICHLKIIKSANFGDFIGYGGYHFKKILDEYQNSKYVDDAEFELIYSYKDEHNYSDVKEIKRNLELFMNKYPYSNKLPEVKKKLKSISDYLEEGGQSIID